MRRPEWHRIKWYGVLAIGVSFSVAGIIMVVVSGEAMAWAAFLFFLLCAAMAVHELWPRLIEGGSTSPDAVLQRFPGPVTLRTSRRKLVFFLVSSIVFGGCLVWVARYGDLSTIGKFFLWFGAAGCAAAVPVFLLLIMRGAALRLDAEGLQVLQGFKRSVHRWADTSEFSVVDVGMPMVIFDEATLMDGTVAQFNRNLIGRSGALPDTYGLDAWSLAWLLNEWRARALANPPPPSQSPPAP